MIFTKPRIVILCSSPSPSFITHSPKARPPYTSTCPADGLIQGIAGTFALVVLVTLIFTIYASHRAHREDGKARADVLGRGKESVVVRGVPRPSKSWVQRSRAPFESGGERTGVQRGMAEPGEKRETSGHTKEMSMARTGSAMGTFNKSGTEREVLGRSQASVQGMETGDGKERAREQRQRDRIKLSSSESRKKEGKGLVNVNSHRR